MFTLQSRDNAHLNNLESMMKEWLFALMHFFSTSLVTFSCGEVQCSRHGLWCVHSLTYLFSYVLLQSLQCLPFSTLSCGINVLVKLYIDLYCHSCHWSHISLYSGQVDI